ERNRTLKDLSALAARLYADRALCPVSVPAAVRFFCTRFICFVSTVFPGAVPRCCRMPTRTSVWHWADASETSARHGETVVVVVLVVLVLVVDVVPPA